jgi:hypothetical protein
MKGVRMLVLALLMIAVSVTARAQVQTGSITGTVTDESNAVLPGATVSITGEKLIGGTQTQTADATGAYRFDRLPPGSYNLTFELQGFKTFERKDIVVNATFVATVNAKLGVGSVSETVTVTGESPTVDTRSNLQQTVMNQTVLEGVPSGRDPWSVAKIIPGVAISTYDVGGTQSFQQSSFSAHGSSTNDVSFNIDGATVNWPGGGGGATMLYYDQGMFEEVNYMTSAIPAEVLAGGVSINMVTKDAGNRWRANAKYYFSDQNLQSDNTHAAGLPANFPGNPVDKKYDFNLAGGGAVIQDRLWVNGSIRRWIVNKFVAAKNPDGSQALDDNTLKNYSGKGVYAISPNQKASFSYNWNNKIRGHRRDTPPDLVPDIASLVQTNPASSTQAKYNLIHRSLVYESSFSIMKGETDYGYQSTTPATAIRATDTVQDSANFAAQRQEAQPNSRTQFDNIVTVNKSGWAGDHLFKGGVQFARLYFDDRYTVQNGLYLNYANNKATSVTEYNTPTESTNISHVFGGFVQDSWTIAHRLTLNLGARFDHNTGIVPSQSTAGGPFIGPQNINGFDPIHQSLAVWRTGAVYDPLGDGKSAIKASFSRYGLQVGIDRVTNVNPLFASNRTCPWSDPNPLNVLTATTEPSLGTVLGEINTAQCTAFPGLKVQYADKTNGPKWPYSDEITAGVEREVVKDMRVGVVYYHRTNRDQIGVANAAVTPDMYVPVTINVPNGPNGATTATLYNLASPAYNSLANYVYANSSYLDTNYNGVEITANKRMSDRWQMVAGLTIGANKGGVNAGGTGTGQAGSLGTIGSATEGDLNDPNATLYSNGNVGYDQKVQFRLSGSYILPYDISIAGSLISNTGYPYSSTYTVTRSIYPQLVRASQVVFLSGHTERYPSVTTSDLRFSRAFKFGPRQIVPQVDIFNITNSAAIVGLNAAIGGSYLVPTQILSPRIVQFGFSLDF